MRYWILTPAQENNMLFRFPGVNVATRSGQSVHWTYSSEFALCASRLVDYEERVDVPVDLVEEFETLLVRGAQAGLVFDILGKEAS